MSKKKIVLIVVSAVLTLFIILCGLLAYYIFGERDKVSYDINEWSNLEKTFTYLPSVEEMGEYSDLKSKYQHRDYFIFQSDAYILRATYSKDIFDWQKDSILNNYSFQETVVDYGEETIAIRKITYKGSERICNYAFEYANKIGLKKVTAAHKANILPLTDGVFKKSFYKEAKKYPHIKANDYYIDAMAMYLITNPAQFNVIVTTNLFGDILSDQGGGLLGSLGLIPSANIGKDNGLFEPVHGSAPDIAGQNKANPIAMILSSSLMLEFLGMQKEAYNIQKTIENVIKEGKVKTPDLGGTNNTQEMSDEIIRKL